jgi:hypothetical protein
MFQLNAAALVATKFPEYPFNLCLCFVDVIDLAASPFYRCILNLNIAADKMENPIKKHINIVR